MWQLRKLSTNEPLSEAGPLPNNWGPIFGLSGFLDKIGDLSWVGSSFVDQGWVELTETEQKEYRISKIVERINIEKVVANTALSDPAITVESKIAWNDYLVALDAVCLSPDFDCDPKLPISPSA
tara:strand:+ start:596 stop:967 length:372 start_codon:yes stop_codon:yes gene_type:complete